MKAHIPSPLLTICLAALSLLALPFTVVAQPSASFFVFSLKGNGYYLRDKFHIPLKIGSALSVTDEVFLAPKSEVKLLCNKATLFTIVSKGAVSSTRLAAYADSCKTAEKSTATKTLSYIWNRFTAGEEADVAKNKNEYLQEYGADTRGCNDPLYNGFPDTLSVYRQAFFLRYQPADTAENYQLAIFVNDHGGSALSQSSLMGGRFALTESLFRQLDTGSVYYYTITRNGQEYCKRKILHRLSDHTIATLREKIAAGKDFSALSPADKQAITAYFFEKVHLLGEASASYAEAIRKNPGNPLATLQAGNLDRWVGVR